MSEQKPTIITPETLQQVYNEFAVHVIDEISSMRSFVTAYTNSVREMMKYLPKEPPKNDNQFQNIPLETLTQTPTQTPEYNQ